MPDGRDVSLPASCEPVFPDRCVVCGEGEPEKLVDVESFQPHVWSVFNPFATSWFSAACPVCSGCEARLRNVSAIRFGVGFLLFMGGAFLSGWLISVLWPSGQSGLRLLGLLGGVLANMAWSRWCGRHPKYVELVAGPSEVCYRFADPEYARQFEALNRDPDVDA